jgi:hypothetical protein
MTEPRHAGEAADAAPPSIGPILAPPGASPALASDPFRELDPAHQVYEANPAPWWVAAMWITFLVGGAAYLVVNLIR